MAERKSYTIVLEGEQPIEFRTLSTGMFEVTTTIGDQLTVACLDDLPSSRFTVHTGYNQSYCVNDDGKTSKEGINYVRNHTNPAIQ